MGWGALGRLGSTKSIAPQSLAGMISLGETLDLDFEVKALLAGEKWQGPFNELLNGPTIVSVYMRNNTSSCDRQTQQMNEVAPELRAAGIGLIGLSKDTFGSHQKYACKLDLDFPLVSDPDHLFAKATKSLVEKKMYGKIFFGPTRSAYLVDVDGAVKGVVERIDSANHAEELRRLAKAL